MSWSDPCSDCGNVRASCECGMPSDKIRIIKMSISKIIKESFEGKMIRVVKYQHPTNKGEYLYVSDPSYLRADIEYEFCHKIIHEVDVKVYDQESTSYTFYFSDGHIWIGSEIEEFEIVK